MSSPNYPTSFMPHPNSSPFIVKNNEKVAPQKIFLITSSFKASIIRGSGTLLLYIPVPGSNESPEKPSPSYP